MAALATSHKPSRSSSTEKAKSRSRIRDARIALNEPAHLIAQRARARYRESQQTLRLPSKKPRIVTTPVRQDKTFVWVMRLFGVGIVASLFVVVGIQTTIAKRQITIDSIRTEQKKEITKFEKMRQEVASLKTPERITRRASYLGLVQPARFVSVSIPMPVAARTDKSNDELWSEVKAIINATS